MERSLHHQGEGLKEYSVGIDALGKPDTYNPRQDATVRILTGRLRARLEEYFRTEGTADPVLFNLPKGGFKVLFEDRSGSVTAARPELATLIATPHLRWPLLGMAILLVAATAVAIRATVVLSQSAPGRELAASIWTPELETVWAPFLSDKRPLTLSLGTPLFISLDGLAVRDPSQNQWNDGHLSPRPGAIRDALQAADVHASYPYNGFGETAGAFRLFRLFLSRGRDLTFRRSNSLSWEDFRERDLILLGSPKSVLHLKYFRDLRTKLAFDVEEKRIVNNTPEKGEAASYQNTGGTGGSTYDGYALVTRLPGLGGAGQLMILASPDSEGTLAACEYVTNGTTAGELVRQFGASGQPLPEAYQVLLKVTSRADVPLAITAIAHRTLRPDRTAAP